MNVVHVIGAGLAGISAARHLAEAGCEVSLYEASPQAGGRCRSYADAQLGCEIDNGNHLLLKGNREARELIQAIGAQDCWREGEACYSFHDVVYGTQWQWKPPYWLPKLPLFSYLRLLQLLFRRHVASAIPPHSALGKRWAVPFCVSALNTQPQEARSRELLMLLWQIMRGGRDAAIPYVAVKPFREALIDPALQHLRDKGVSLYFQSRLQGLAIQNGRITQLRFAGQARAVGERDRVILAVPPREAARLLPQLVVPQHYEAIVNLHFRYAHAQVPGSVAGLSGSGAEWVFFKEGEVVSTTTSAASHVSAEERDVLAQQVWQDIAAVYGFDMNLPPHRMVTEKHATFTATIENAGKRPPNKTLMENLWLAGDYTNTGLPATIEGAIRSGRLAAQQCLASARLQTT
jgi:squalene-associated FAD-dependent desaturase